MKHLGQNVYTSKTLPNWTLYTLDAITLDSRREKVKEKGGREKEKEEEKKEVIETSNPGNTYFRTYESK